MEFLNTHQIGLLSSYNFQKTLVVMLNGLVILLSSVSEQTKFDVKPIFLFIQEV